MIFTEKSHPGLKASLYKASLMERKKTWHVCSAMLLKGCCHTEQFLARTLFISASLVITEWSTVTSQKTSWKWPENAGKIKLDSIWLTSWKDDTFCKSWKDRRLPISNWVSEKKERFMIMFFVKSVGGATAPLYPATVWDCNQTAIFARLEACGKILDFSYMLKAISRRTSHVSH